MSHSKTINVIVEEYKSNIKSGLTSEQAEERLRENGFNKLSEKRKKSMFSRFILQFKDLMIIILLIAAGLSLFMAFQSGELHEFFEPGLIILIVIINAVIGVMQESKAEKALDALKSLTAPEARVIRDGKEQKIPAEEIVTGDVIYIEAGDFVPADARLIESFNLKAEESALTGESVPSEKDADAVVPDNAGIGDRTNMVFSGCGITYGAGTAIVTKVGMDTEMGKIAKLLDNETETETPLQKKLSDLGRVLGIVALAACAIIFAVGLLDGLELRNLFMTSVSLAVSAIPEGLPAIVTIVLSIGVQRMVKQNAIIRRLPAVETLGSASVICSDKTGTLTQNRMTLVETFLDSGKSEKITDSNSEDVKKMLKYATLCSDGSVTVEQDGTVKHLGDPTETSIVLAALNNGLAKDEINAEFPRVCGVPFDSDRKLMSTVHDLKNGKYLVIVKGAFDMLVPKCVEGNIMHAADICIKMSENALRVIAVAYKEISAFPGKNPKPDDLEYGLTFMGLVGMIDPPRPEAKEAVSICRTAGIRPVMITGDHVLTASAIAKEIGIKLPQDRSVTGAELDLMSDDELGAEIENISVYARVSPENKIRIVKAWQKKDHVVSMTGDGVNDAPALKAADIGCAMGITGTDVAKCAADMTLTDDNFSTIVAAVKEGRGIYDNIKKVTAFLLGTNTGEVLTVFFAMLLWKKTPLVSMQLLWINLVTDSLPAIALGMEPVEKDIMNRKPKPKSEGIFSGGLGLRVIMQGIMFAVLTLAAFQIGHNAVDIPNAAVYEVSYSKETVDTYADKVTVTKTEQHKNIVPEEGGRTMAFLVLAMCQIVQAYNMRSNKSLFKTGFFTNRHLNLAALVSSLLMAIVLFVPPVSIVFDLLPVTEMPAHLYLIGLGLALVPLPVMELGKIGKIRKADGH
jgi:Ca2+-transporting ATPase